MKRSGTMTGPARRRMRRARGMTLVEVLAVVAILGLIAGTLAIGLSGAFAQGKRELAKTAIGLAAQRVETYYVARGSYPSPDIGLAALTDGHATGVDAYYLKPDQILDPWGHRLVLVVPGPNGQPYEIVSYGRDGRPGGEGEDADLSSAALRSE